jgi:hypothetical protein
MDDIAGGALGDGVLAEDLREESVKLRAVHVLRHAARGVVDCSTPEKYVSVIIQRQRFYVLRWL